MDAKMDQMLALLHQLTASSAQSSSGSDQAQSASQ